MLARRLPAWGATGTQALRGTGFLMFAAAFQVPETEKVLNRELVNEAMTLGTCTLQRRHWELLSTLVQE